MRTIEAFKNSVYGFFNRGLIDGATAPLGNTRRVHLLFTPEYRNFGDQAIAQGASRLVQDATHGGVELLEEPNAFCLRFPDKLDALIAEDDVLVLTGGGFLGDLWPMLESCVEDILERHRTNPLVILPSTIYFRDDKSPSAMALSELIGQRRDYFVCLRERNSLAVCTQALGLDADRCAVLPDCALYLTDYVYDGTRQGVGICLRDDIEQTSVLGSGDLRVIGEMTGSRCRVISTTGNMAIPIPVAKRDSALREAIKPFQRAELIVTDRLHGMLFAAISGTPVVALDNVSRKVSGVYDAWLRDLGYVRVARDASELARCIQEIVTIPVESRLDALGRLQARLRGEHFARIQDRIWEMASNDD